MSKQVELGKNPASKVIAAFEMIIPNTQMLSYTSYMAQRLFEMHRGSKTQEAWWALGSLDLTEDPEPISHYLKCDKSAERARRCISN